MVGTFRLRATRALVLAVMVAVGESCGGDSGTGPVVTSVAFAQAAYSVGVGATMQIGAFFYDDKHNLIDTPVSDATWATSNGAVAAVDEHGSVHGNAIGQARITVSVSGHSATATVTVTPYTVSISPSLAQLDIGQSVQLVATPRDFSGATLPAGAVKWSLTWLGPIAPATVTSSGLLTATTAGTFTVKAEVDGLAGYTDLGVPSAFDGSWTGVTGTLPSPFTATQGSGRQMYLIVHFGAITYFRIADVPAICNQSLLSQFITSEPTPIVSDGFRYSGLPITGTFTSPTTMTGSYSTLAMPGIQCNSGSIPISISMSPNTFSASKQ